MAYGLRIINDNSELLIDSDYVNPTFVQKLEFNATPTSTETGIYSGTIDNLHAGYYKRTYTTATATLNTGTYIVLWTLPDNGNVDVWYNFPTSVMDVNRTLTCEVYASTTGTTLTYTLPTAYIFATDVGSLSSVYSTGPALRMYNSSSEKTFDSHLTQLIPYYISDQFTLANSSSSANINVSSPTNGIYLLPKAYTIYQINATNSPGTTYQVLYDNVYKRYGSTLYSKQISSYWNNVSGSTVLQQYGSGLDGYKSILIADGDLYQGANGSSVTTTNPTYTLSANYATVNETTSKTITVTLTTTNVTNGTVVYYTVTGISAADLTSGSLTGNFIIQTNTASVSFTVATDTLTEGTETFLLSLNGISQSVSVSILDTSRGAYAWSAPSATSVDEGGSSIYLDFNAPNNDPNYFIDFTVEQPAVWADGQSGETIYAYPDLILTTAAGANYTRVTVSARADLKLEGSERWRLKAWVDGNAYYSSDIVINDTTTSSITAADSWIIGVDNNVTITVIGGLGSTVYLLTGSELELKSGSLSSWYINSNNFSVNTTYRALTLTDPNTLGANIGLFRQNAAGAQLEGLASKWVTVSPTYSWATTPLSVNEGATGSLQFNYTNAPANTVINFTLQPPLMGASASTPADGTLTTTSFTTGTTVSSGSVSVGYSIVADSLTEGTEYFSLRATIGTSTYNSADITINDTSQSPSYGITAVSAPWNESTTQSTTVSLSNVNGYTYYPTSDNAAVVCQTTSFSVTSNSFTTTLYWNVGAVSADTTVTLYLRRSRSNGTIDAQTSVTVKDILPAGTAIGSAYCLNNGVSPYTLRQVYANGSGGTYNTDTNNSVTCGYIAPTYSLVATPTSVNEGSSFTITLTTNQSGSFPYTITGISSADIGNTSLTGTLANGGSRTINVTADLSVGEGTEYFVATLDNGLATTGSVTINDTSVTTLVISQTGNTYGSVNAAFSSSFTLAVNGSAAAANWSVSGTIPAGLALTKTGNTSGVYYTTYTLSGTPTTITSYTFTITASTASSGSTSLLVTVPIYAQSGTNSGTTYCGTGTNKYTLYQDKNDGAGGTYQTTVSTNSVTCGYVAPSYSLSNTTTGTISNGGGFTFTHNANNADGTAVSFSVTGAGASYVTLSPSSFTVSGASEAKSISVTTTARAGGTAAQSVTITPNTCTGFSFTLAAVASVAPTVTGISRLSAATVNNGDRGQAKITWSGGITSTTYMQIELTLGAYAPYYNSGNPIVNNYATGITYEDVTFYVGATDATYLLPTNPGTFSTTLSVRARSVAADGVTGTSSWTSPLTFSYKNASGVVN